MPSADTVIESRPRTSPAIDTPPALSALASACRYVGDREPGLSRRRVGRAGYRYVRPDGTPVTDEPTLRRIAALAIPPAWEQVWVCADADGHVQATGRDLRGRKQYRYHARFREARDETKFERALAFARALPRIRRRVRRDLRAARHGPLGREAVLATVVQLLERTLIRVGHAEYARRNRSYGLATMRERHVRIRGPRIEFRFRGKAGKDHQVEIEDPQLARILRRCTGLPGEELFQYVDPDGQPRPISAADVNGYLREAAGDEFTAKDYRTWAGTVLAAEILRRRPHRTRAEAERHVKDAIAEVARRLGNTPAICKRCYVHPEILSAYRRGALGRALARVRRGEAPFISAERDVGALLRRSLRAGRRAAGARAKAGVSR